MFLFWCFYHWEWLPPNMRGTKRSFSIQMFCSSWQHMVDPHHMWAQVTVTWRACSFHRTQTILNCDPAFMQWLAYSDFISMHQYIITLQAEKNEFSTHTGTGEETSCWKTLVGFLLRGINFPAEGKTKRPSLCNFLSSLLQTHTGRWLTRLV